MTPTSPTKSFNPLLLLQYQDNNSIFQNDLIWGPYLTMILQCNLVTLFDYTWWYTPKQLFTPTSASSSSLHFPASGLHMHGFRRHIPLKDAYKLVKRPTVSEISSKFVSLYLILPLYNWY